MFVDADTAYQISKPTRPMRSNWGIPLATLEDSKRLNMNKKQDEISSQKRELSRKQYEEKYSYRCSIRLSKIELDSINSKRRSESLPRYLINAALKRKVPKQKASGLSAAILSELATEVGRIGNNMNQLARLSNIERINKSTNTSHIEEELSRIRPIFFETLTKILSELEK